MTTAWESKMNALIENKEWQWANANAKCSQLKCKLRPEDVELPDEEQFEVNAKTLVSSRKKKKKKKNCSQANWLCKLCAKWLLQRAATNKRANRAGIGLRKWGPNWHEIAPFNY